ncbi:MAG TPA: SIS domain-containing protein [bacterium]|nr:SIS domain-containing protein [Candidatus Omnitrophota bacterium]HOJ59381.1 SIS domain-containing protein [bacterium]HOL94150.1 SIS domain-containing protein [bacterium]HPP01177.1 SIS domain-containing protein [bacterium]HXK95621.1 SIS domain-containing protein [bacterium]
MTFAQYLETFGGLLNKVNPREVEALVDAITDAYEQDQFVFLIGNGGSGANASHFCEDLGKGTLCDFEHQKRLKVISLTDNTPYILAWANDTSYDRIFVEQLKNLAQPGALLIAISGSGNSANVLRAVEYANANGLRTFGMTGYDGGRLRQIAQQNLHVPSYDMGDVESVHAVCIHYVLKSLFQRFKQLHEACA